MNTKYVLSPKDLQTKHEDTVKGFLIQALQKTQKAEPFVKRAREFQSALCATNSIEEAANLSDFELELAAACGFSDKAMSQLSEPELRGAIKQVLETMKENATDGFRDEILFRYLLTKGDTLGGSMRNVTGASAGKKLTDSILNKLKTKGEKVEITASKLGKVQSINWPGKIMLFDVKPKMIGKNIDVILLKLPDGVDPLNALEQPELYVACGELKGGIDPAGADEHWKTANSALGRIRNHFNGAGPGLFFVGAAIEASMAEEIYKQLESGELSFAANLNNEQQLDDLVTWLCL